MYFNTKREKRTDLLIWEPLNSWIVKYLIWILSSKYYGFLVLLNHKSRSNLKWIWNRKTFQGLNNLNIVHETDQGIEFDWNCNVIYNVYVSICKFYKHMKVIVLHTLICDIKLYTVSSGKQDGLIPKLEEKFSVLYTRSSYNKGRLIHVFFVQTEQNLETI